MVYAEPHDRHGAEESWIQEKGEGLLVVVGEGTDEGIGGPREEEVVRMTPIRRKIASHLLNAQQNAALLTTFNEVDMSNVMDIRKQFKESYTNKHGVKLGFMSFFVKACIDGLKAFPAVNAEIREENIIYKNYQDIGIAVSGKKGLVVPVLRNAERMSFADVEANIGDEYVNQVYGFASHALGGVKVRVRQEDEKRALAILADTGFDATTNGAEP